MIIKWRARAFDINYVTWKLNATASLWPRVLLMPRYKVTGRKIIPGCLPPPHPCLKFDREINRRKRWFFVDFTIANAQWFWSKLNFYSYSKRNVHGGIFFCSIVSWTKFISFSYFNGLSLLVKSGEEAWRVSCRIVMRYGYERNLLRISIIYVF